MQDPIPLSPADQAALFEMRMTFGHHKIWYGMDCWRARRNDNIREIFTAGTPGELRQQLEADLAAWRQESGVQA